LLSLGFGIVFDYIFSKWRQKVVIYGAD